MANEACFNFFNKTLKQVFIANDRFMFNFE